MFLVAPPLAAAQEVWNATDWTAYDTITIDATQVDDDLTDFPVYVDLADLSATFWATTPSASTTVGTDIRVTTNDGSPVELPRELVSASSTAQTGELHFKANSISSTTDTVFRVYYNGTTTGDYATSSTYGAQNAWTNDFLAVYHLGDGDSTATGFYKDSTSNNADATLVDSDGDVAVTPGTVGGAIDFNGDTGDYIGYDATNASRGELTVTSWHRIDGGGGTNWAVFGSDDAGSANSMILEYRSDSTFRFRVQGETDVSYAYPDRGSWLYSAATMDDTAMRVYLSGQEVASSTATSTVQVNNYIIGLKNDLLGQMNGPIDEVRIASTTRSAAWIGAEYINQATTTDFYSAAEFTVATILTAATTTDPTSFSIAPGSSATTTNTFTFQTEVGTDVITDITIAHRNASSTSLIEVTSADGSTVYGSVSNPTGTSSVITLSTNTLTATVTETTYAVRVTPKSQANLPAGVFGSLIPVSFVVDSWSGTNTQLGSDTSFPVFIDNESLAAFGITGSSSFAVRVDYADELNVPAVSAADFDGDGYVDFASVGDESPGTVSVFINDGDGTFAARVEYTTDTNPVAVSYEDLDGDGDLDLFTTSRVTDKVSVLMNNGDGTFAAQVTYETGVTPYYVTSADIDNNGTPDLLVLNVASNTVSVLTNNGDGTFAAKVDYGVGDSSFGGGIDASDFDSDGYLDVVVGNGGDDTISILMNNGDGTFATEVTYATGPAPYSVAVADFDGDSDPDVVVANGFDQTVSVFIGAGDGTFAAKVDYTVGFSPFSVRTADLDNDGDEDIITADFGENTISVLLNNGNGTFAAKVGFVAGVSNVSPNAVADFNNDGFIDVVIGQSGFSSVLLNNSTSSLTATTSPGGFIATYTTPPQSE